MIVVGLAAASPDAQIKFRLRKKPAPSPAAGVLSFNNLSVVGCFRTPDINIGYDSSAPTVNKHWAGTPAMAMTTSGTAHTFFVLQNFDGHIIEFDQPASLSPCTNAVASITQASTVHDWGALPFDYRDATDGVTSAVLGLGLGVDALDTTKLYVTASGTYTNHPPSVATIYRYVFGATTLTFDGCWVPNPRSGVTNGYGQPMSAFGVKNIPASFISAYGLGTKRLSVNGGITASVSSYNSHGPSAEAIDVPTTNACPSWTPTPLPAGPVLLRYPSNDDGPVCLDQNQPHSPNAGCTPTNPPSSPYHGRMAWTGYSGREYTVSWEPWDFGGGRGRQGFFSINNTANACDFYDDGSLAAYICATRVASGFFNGTVASVSYSGGSGTMTLSGSGSLANDTGDGAGFVVGESFYVETCPSCTIPDPNMVNYSFLTVTGVNNATRTVDFTVIVCDIPSENCEPMVGQQVLLGIEYYRGVNQPPRNDLRLQLYDLADLGAVAQGTDDWWEPEYTEDESITHGTYPWLTALGYPGSALGGIAPAPSAPRPNGIFADNANRQVVYCVSNAVNSTTTPSLCMVLQVGD